MMENFFHNALNPVVSLMFRAIKFHYMLKVSTPTSFIAYKLQMENIALLSLFMIYQQPILLNRFVIFSLQKKKLTHYGAMAFNCSLLNLKIILTQITKCMR